MGSETEAKPNEKIAFDQVITKDEQIEELIQLLRRLELQRYKEVEVVVKVRHK